MFAASGEKLAAARSNDNGGTDLCQTGVGNLPSIDFDNTKAAMTMRGKI
jgi:hypothetical protein